MSDDRERDLYIAETRARERRTPEEWARLRAAANERRLARQRNNWEAEEDARLFAEGQCEDWEREGR